MKRPSPRGTPDVLPVSPGLEPAIASTGADVVLPPEYQSLTRRSVFIAVLAIAIALGAGFVAQILLAVIGFVTNVAFFGRVSTSFASPGDAPIGLRTVVVPVLGGLIVGVMARWGSAAIRGHGIPEVMEKVLYGESRIPPRLLVLKPLSAAVAIGTGGPFGAEGPIIATGGALGSLVGQIVHVAADERKTLLAAGAAAGMAATFGAPVSAVLLAVELLLFEYRPRSLVPVALAAATATGVRLVFHGSAPVFAMPLVTPPSGSALAAYVVLGAIIGLLAVAITRGVYGLEAAFERLPIHWMWWPALGGLAVGLVGLLEPRTLGVGYDNISAAIGGGVVGRALIVLAVLKFISWAIALSSGTSGGTLAPLFTIGGSVGAWLGGLAAVAAPGLGVDPRVAGLVGMAAIFAGASHALLTSVVFAFETTRQPLGLLPLLAGCAAAYLVALLSGRHSIMTERLARRGTRVRTELAADHLGLIGVGDTASRDVVSLEADVPLRDVRAWLAAGAGGARHQGFPVLDGAGRLVGVLTRRNLLDPTQSDDAPVRTLITRPPVVVFEDSTLRDAADQMVRARIGRLPVVRREAPRVVTGFVTRSDLLAAHAGRLEAEGA